MQPEFFYIASNYPKVEPKCLYNYAKKSRNFETCKSPGNDFAYIGQTYLAI